MNISAKFKRLAILRLLVVVPTILLEARSLREQRFFSGRGQPFGQKRCICRRHGDLTRVAVGGGKLWGFRGAAT